MDKIEQLRDDISTLEAAQDVLARRYERSCYTDDQLKEMRYQLAKLEAEEDDPWKHAKESIPLHLENGGHRVKAVAQYARHLEDQVAELKAQIASEKQTSRADQSRVWAEAKETLDWYIDRRKKNNIPISHLAEYAIYLETQSKEGTDEYYISHLQNRIAELEYELNQRPQLWCERMKDTGQLCTIFRTDEQPPWIFTTPEYAQNFLGKNAEIKLYTGQKNERD